ncbi:reverse transcriptase domain-containing protein [Tanacetum coccineum]
MLRALADLKSILYGSYLERSCIETLFELKHSEDCYLETSIIPCVGNLVIMSPRMTTRSACRSTAAPRGERTGRQTGRESGRTKEPRGRELTSRYLSPSRKPCNNQGNNRNQNGNAINDNIQGDVRNVIVNNSRRGYSYKEFLACNPKEYDGKGGAIVYTRWIEKIESVQDMSGCGDDQKVKYNAGLFISKALTWWNYQIHTRGRETIVGMPWEDFKTLMREEFCSNNERQKLETELVPHLVTPENKNIYGLAPQIRRMVAATEPTTIQKAVQKAGTLTDEAIRNGSLKRNPERRGNGGEPSRDRNVNDDNKRTRTGNAFATTANPVRREYTGAAPKCVNCKLHHSLKMPCRACFNCNRLGHLAKDCRVVPRVVNPENARNPTTAHGACFECGGTDHFKAACPKLNQAQIITEYLVNISKRRAFWSLNEDILKINDSDYQYAVSIKEDTTYSCLHSPKTTKERRSIRRIQRKSIRHNPNFS